MRLSLVAILLISAAMLSYSSFTYAGKVVVRKSSEPFDAFAVRDQVLAEHEWKEALRLQRSLTIIQSLPSGCIVTPTPYQYYRCGNQFYRPYPHNKQQLFIQIDPPKKR